jgi:hypothetical protein
VQLAPLERITVGTAPPDNQDVALVAFVLQNLMLLAPTLMIVQRMHITLIQPILIRQIWTNFQI